MKFIKKFEKYTLQSKCKEVGDITFPEFKGDKIYMLEFDLENPKLPSKYKRWESVINEMIKKSPVKSGKAYLTVDEQKVEPGTSHRRGGVHVDGNFIYGFKEGKVVEIETKPEPEIGDERSEEFNWGYDPSVGWNKKEEDEDEEVINQASWVRDNPDTSWATGFLVGGLSEEQHMRQYCSDKGGIIIASNYEASRGWEGDFKNIPYGGGDCSHINLDGLNEFKLKANKAYLGNSTFLHESLKIDEGVNRQMIRITLPEVKVL